MYAKWRVCEILVLLAIASKVLLAAEGVIATTPRLECDVAGHHSVRSPAVLDSRTGREIYFELERTVSGESCILQWQVWFRPSAANAWRIFGFQTTEERFWSVQFDLLGFMASRPIAVAVASRSAGDYAEADLVMISLDSGRIHRINPRLGLPKRNQPKGRCPVYVSPTGLLSMDQIIVDTQSLIMDIPEGAKPCWPKSRWVVGIEARIWRRTSKVEPIRLLGTVIGNSRQ